MKKILWKIFGIKSVNFYLAVILIGVVISCGTRKSAINKTYSKKDTLITNLMHKNIKVDSNYTIDFSSFKIYPIDVSKPVLINSVKIENATIEVVSKKEVVNYSKIDKTSIEEVKKISTVERKKDKETQKSDTANLWLGIAFVIGLVIYFLIRKGIFRN